MRRNFLVFASILIAVCMVGTWLAALFLPNLGLRAAISAALALAAFCSAFSYQKSWFSNRENAQIMWGAGREREALSEAQTLDMPLAAGLMQQIHKERQASNTAGRRHKLLMEIMEQLRSSSEPSAELVPVLMRIMNGIKDGTGFDKLFLFFYDQNSNFIPGGLQVGGDEQDIDRIRQKLENGGLWSDNLPIPGCSDPVIVKHEQTPQALVVLSPIERDGIRTALLVVEASSGNSEDITRWGNILDEMSSYIGFAIHEADILDKLFAHAHWDPTTSTLKHGYLHDRIHDEIDRAKRYDYQFSFIVISIRDYQQMRTKFGKAGAASKLADLGNMIHNNKRSIDLLARFGIENLALLLPQTAAKQATVMARRIVDFANRELDMDIILGLAEYPSDGVAPLELIDKALALIEAPGGPSIRMAS